MSQVREEEKPHNRAMSVVAPTTMTVQPSHTMSDLARMVYEQQPVSQEVKDALAKFDYKPITRSDLGQYMGLNPNELVQLDMFWDPAFGKGWIYLSDEVIAAQMTTKTGKNAVSQFYDEILDVDETKLVNGVNPRKDYIDGVHFKRLAWNDPLIDLYFKSCSPPSGSNSKRKNVAGKRHYAVSGDTYSDLLSRAATESGKIARSLFRKIVIGTRLMLEYINAMHAIIAQGRIEDAKVETRLTTAKLNRLHTLNSSLVCCKKLEGLSGRIYIIADEVYASQGIFKLGRTKAMAPRMKTHNSDKIIGSTYVILAEFAVQDEVLIEHYIHAKLIHLRVKGETEIFMAPFQELFDIARLIIDSDAGVTAYVNAAVDVRYNLEQEEFKSSDWMRGVPDETFGPRYYQSANAIAGKIAVSEMNNTELLKVAQFAITLYIRAKHEIEYILPEDASKIITPTIDIKWSDLFNIVKSMLQRGEGTKFSKQESEWSTLFGNALTGAVSINYVVRRIFRSKTVTPVNKPIELPSITLLVDT